MWIIRIESPVVCYWADGDVTTAKDGATRFADYGSACDAIDDMPAGLMGLAVVVRP